MATCSSILAWKIPWREEPGRLQSMGLQRVGHDELLRSHRDYFQRSFVCGMGQCFIPFDSWIIFHCTDIAVHISWWAFGIVPTLGAIMSNTAMNIHSYPSFCVDICFHFSCIYNRVESLGHMLTLFLTFWGTARLSSTAAASLCIPISSGWKFWFHCLLATTCYCVFWF